MATLLSTRFLNFIDPKVKKGSALRVSVVKRLKARVTVLTEDLEIAEGEASRAQESADSWQTRFVKTVETATKVLERMEAADDKLKEIAKLVDSDYNNGMILGGYELTGSIRGILK